MNRWLCIALLALVQPVSAAVVLMTGCEDGRSCIPDANSRGMWSGSVGSGFVQEPNAVTPVKIETGNNWSMALEPSSGSDLNVYKDITLTNDWSVHVNLMITTAPIEEDIIIKGMAGANTQVFLTLGPDRRLRLYYADTATECAQAANNGQPCDDLDDCEEINEGEARCAEAVFARSQQLSLDTWYEIGVQQDMSASTCDAVASLWIDGLERGTRTRAQGLCSGGANVGDVCSVSADCPGSSCACTNKQTNRLVFGWSGDVADLDKRINFDSIVIESTTASDDMMYFRLLDLHPVSTASNTNWTLNGCSGGNAAACMDDTLSTGLVDDDTSYLHSNTLNAASIWELGVTASADVTLAADESIGASMPVAVSCNLSEAGNNSTNSGKFVQVGISNSGGSSVMSSNIDVATEAGGSAQPDYKSGPPVIITTEPDGTTWDGLSDVTGMRLRLLFTGTDNADYRVRATDCHVEILIDRSRPASPSETADWNNDGEKTLCYAGDSRFNQQSLEHELNARLTEFHNVIRCAFGGRRIADIVDDWTEIMNGVGGDRVACEAMKGSNAKCDVAILDIGVNDAGSHPWYPREGICHQSWCADDPATGCDDDSDCIGSTCGGAEHGQPCALPRGRHTELAGAEVSYCSRGTDFVAKTLHVPPTPCPAVPPPWVFSATCVGGANAGGSCTNDGSCPGGTCTPYCAGGPILGHTGDCAYDSALTGTWCAPGSLESPSCPGGLCVRATQHTYWENGMVGLIEAAQARTGSNTVKLILAFPFPSMFPPPTSSINCFFGRTIADLQQQRTTMMELANRYGLDWIDMKAEFRDQCPDHNPHHCLGCPPDGLWCPTAQVHPSTEANPALAGYVNGDAFGDSIIGKVFEDCLEFNTSNANVDCDHLKVTCPDPRTSVPASATGGTHNDDAVGSTSCTTGANVAGYKADSISVYIANPADAGIVCSIYTLGGSTVTKVNSACDTVATIAQAGWNTFATFTPSSCTLAANTAYYVLCNTNSASLTYGATSGQSNALRTTNGSNVYPALPSSSASSASNFRVANYISLRAQ